MKIFNIGAFGENAACKYLKNKNYRILKRNYRKTYGEIDIIAQKGELISFIEVKMRKNADYGLACEFVTKSKQNKIKKAAYTYISENNCDADFSFDIIEVYHDSGKICRIEHIENAYI